MKCWPIVLLLLIYLGSAFPPEALPSVEPFSDATASRGSAYASGAPLFHQTNALGESWAAWNGGTTTSFVSCTNLGLSYAGFPPMFPAAPATNAAYLPGQADHAGGLAGMSAALTFTRPVKADPANSATNAVFASFLLQVPDLGNLTTGGPIYFAGFATNTGDQTVSLPASALKIYLRGNSATAGQSTAWSVGVANNSGSGSAVWEDATHNSNEVLFVVVSYQFGINGNPDVARLWVNPFGSTFTAPTPPTPSGSTNITSKANQLAQASDFFLLARTGSTLWGRLLLGDLRVGTTWGFVTSPYLRFNQPVRRGTGLALSGSGGARGNSFTLLTSTNLALPRTNWTSATTNQFDALGQFSLTNPISSSAGRQFYSVQVPPPSNDLWIPACGAWLGAEVTNGTDGISWTQANTDHEARIGRQLDILREYHTPGSWTALTSAELAYINAGRKVFISFKPNSDWSKAVGVANGGSATVDSQLTSLAKSVAGIKPKRLMLCVWHEPENDVGSAGTTNEYVAMWHNVRTIFDGNGATNVIWCWAIENYGPLRYLLAGLWPGNSYVDWVGWDQYQGSAGNGIISVQTDAYNYLLANSDASHTYTSKPWAWAEWGIGINGWFPTTAQQVSAFDAVNVALNACQFPRVRYIAYFDLDSGPNSSSAILSGALGSYSNLANSPYLYQRCQP